MKLSNTLLKEWFDFGILWLSDSMDAAPTLAFVAVAHLCEVDWNGIGSQNLFQYQCKTGNVSRVSELAPIVCKLADGTEIKVERTESLRPIRLEELATRYFSFEFGNAVCLQYFEKKMDYFVVRSLDAQEALLKRSSSFATSVMDKGQVPPAALAVADGSDNHDEWVLESAVRLEDVVRIGAKRRLRDFRDNHCAKKRKISGRVTEAFDFTTELADQEAHVDIVLSAELVSVKDVLAIAQVTPKDANEQSVSLQQKHNT